MEAGGFQNLVTGKDSRGGGGALQDQDLVGVQWGRGVWGALIWCSLGRPGAPILPDLVIFEPRLSLDASWRVRGREARRAPHG